MGVTPFLGSWGEPSGRAEKSDAFIQKHTESADDQRDRFRVVSPI